MREHLAVVAVAASVGVGALPLTGVQLTAVEAWLLLFTLDRGGQGSGGGVSAGWWLWELALLQLELTNCPRSPQASYELGSIRPRRIHSEGEC